jgi:hypothetical protein
MVARATSDLERSEVGGPRTAVDFLSPITRPRSMVRAEEIFLDIGA